MLVLGLTDTTALKVYNAPLGAKRFTLTTTRTWQIDGEHGAYGSVSCEHSIPFDLQGDLIFPEAVVTAYEEMRACN